MAEQSQSADTIERVQKGLVVALIAIVVILVLVIAFRHVRGGADLAALPSSTAPSAEDGGREEVSALLARARHAMAESRLVAPAGDNAYEAYLAVLDVDADQRSAREAVNDLYGIAVSGTEQAIAIGDFAEAARLAELLAKANPDSFTVNNLRQRIERAQALVDAAEQQAALALSRQAQVQRVQASAEQAQEPAPTAPVGAGGSSDTAGQGEIDSVPATASVDTSSQNQVAGQSPPPPPVAPAAVRSAAESLPATTRTAVTTTPAVASAAPVVREARLLSRVDPEYPVEAMRTRQQGWVEVDFVIGADGLVDDVRVAGSRPGRIFDRAAIRAIQGWRFEPRMENGQPVATRMRQRFDFRVD